MVAKVNKKRQQKKKTTKQNAEFNDSENLDKVSRLYIWKDVTCLFYNKKCKYCEEFVPIIK